MSQIANKSGNRVDIAMKLASICSNKYFLAFVFLFTLNSPSWADYKVTGSIKASVCRGIGIEFCRFEIVEAVGRSSGQLYNPAQQYVSVSEFNSSKNICWIRMKTGSMAIDALNAARLPDFFTKRDGKLVKIKPDYLVFSCRKI